MIKKERRTKATPTTLAKGRTEQHLADAPFRDAGASPVSVQYENPKIQIGDFCGKQFLTLARQVKL